jgi:hypothetical protein
LVKAAITQDKSPVLLDTLMSSLLTTFLSYQVTSAGGAAACSKILSKVSSLASNGYLGDSADTLQLLADIVSAFTVLSNANSSLANFPVNQAVRSTHFPCGFMMERNRVVLLYSKEMIPLIVTSSFSSSSRSIVS